jgi:hypothetical protein
MKCWVILEELHDFWLLEKGSAPSPSIFKNIALRKLDLFPSSGEGVGDTRSVGSVRRV